MERDGAGQFTRKNHHVPESYYRPWVGPDGRVATYRTLVPRADCPGWERLITRPRSRFGTAIGQASAAAR